MPGLLREPDDLGLACPNPASQSAPVFDQADLYVRADLFDRADLADLADLVEALERADATLLSSSLPSSLRLLRESDVGLP